MTESENQGKIREMIKEVFTDKRYMRLIVYATIFYFSLYLTAPFGLVYAKTVLDLTNTTITLVMTIPSTVIAFLLMSSWGKALDRYGNKPVMQISAALACISPFFWIFTFPGSNVIVPLIFASALGASMIAGLDLGVQNVFLAQAPDKNRSMYMAMFICVTSLFGMGFGYSFGGWLLDNVLYKIESTGLPFNRYNMLFLVSAIVRFISAFIALPRLIQEENTTPVGEIISSTISDNTIFRYIKNRLGK